MNRLIAVIVLTALCTACASQLQADYRKSVNEMIQGQTANPATLTNPSSAVVTGADPDMVNVAIETMRGHVAKPEDVQRDIVLKVGGK